MGNTFSDSGSTNYDLTATARQLIFYMEKNSTLNPQELNKQDQIRLYDQLIKDLAPALFSEITFAENMATTPSKTNEGVLLVLFEKLNTIKEKQDTPDVKIRADALFHRILELSKREDNPEAFFIKNLRQEMLKCMDFYEEGPDLKGNFLSEAHNKLYLEAKDYAYQHLTKSHGLDLELSEGLSHFIALAEIGESLSPASSPLNKLLCQTECTQFQKSDNLIQMIASDPIIRSSIENLAELLKAQNQMLQDDVKEKGADRLPEEIVAIAIREAFLLPLQEIAQKNLPDGKRLEAIHNLSDQSMIKEQVQGRVDQASDQLILHMIASKADPLKYKDSLFKMVEQSMPPPYDDVSVIKKFCKVCWVSGWAEDMVDLYQKLGKEKKYSKEEILGIISSSIIQSSCLKNLENEDTIARAYYSYAAHNQKSLFYTIGLEHLANYVYDEVIADIQNLQASKTVASTVKTVVAPFDLDTYYNTIKSQIDEYSRGQKTPLSLSPYELYELVGNQFKNDAITSKIIPDTKSFTFIPSIPTTEEKSRKLLEKSLIPLTKERSLSGIMNQLQTAEHKSSLFAELANLQEAKEKDEQWKREEDAKVKPGNLKEALSQKKMEEQDQKGLVLDTPRIKDLLKTDLTLGIKLEDIKAAEGSGKIIVPNSKGEVAYEQAKEAIMSIEEGYNETAFEALFKDLVAKTSPLVSQEFEDNWRRGDKSLFGEDVKNGTGLLTEERRKKILEEAIKLSDKKEMGASLEAFKRGLNRDLEAGRVVPQKEVIRSRYSRFFSFFSSKLKNLTKTEQQEWNSGYTRIVTDALLVQEMKKVQTNPDKVSGGFIENQLLNLRGFGDIDKLEVRTQRHEAEAGVLKTLLQGKGVVGRDLNSIKAKIEKAKLEARLKASNVPEDQIKGYAVLIDVADITHEAMQDAMKEAKGRFSSLPADHPKQHKDLLTDWKGSSIDNYIERVITEALTSITKDPKFEELMKGDESKILEALSLKTNASYEEMLSGGLEKRIEKGFESNIEFYTKWKNCIKGEMIQGITDKQEILGKGVCSGISGRWGANEQKFPGLKVEDLASPEKLKISHLDRLNQAAHGIANKFKQFFFKEKKDPIEKHALSSIEAAYPKPYLDNLGFKKMELLMEVNGILKPDMSSYEQLKEADFKFINEQIVKNASKLKNSNGVMFVNIYFPEGGHRIYMRYDDMKKVYRLGEPNIGIMEFKDGKQLLDCFHDLCTNTYKVNHATFSVGTLK